MSDAKYPDTPKGWRAELKLLKEGKRKLRIAQDGKIDEMALLIARTIHLHKNPEILEGKVWTTKIEKKLFDKVKSCDPLLERDKAHILKAVCGFDRPFLQSLIDAMDLVESGAGIHNPNVMTVIISHASYVVDHRQNPTNRELLSLLQKFAPGIRMDERTLAYICKSQKLPLANAKLGRPTKKSRS